MELYFKFYSAVKIEGMGFYPEHGDPKFREKLMELEEYQMFQVPPMGPVRTLAEYEERVSQFCTGFEKTLYQHLMQHYLSYKSPYRSLLLYHGLGVGKTCSSITIAESLLMDHSSRETQRIWVILPTTLQESYQEQLFSFTRLLDLDKMMEQCTQDTYDRLSANAKDVDVKRRKIEQLIKSRYKMMTYEGFANEVEKLKEKGKLDTLTNKVLIVDEAHNLRIEETDKRAAAALMEVATKCNNNRLVLLSATPMYNEPDEIFWLLSLLLANDKREVPKFGSLFKTDGNPSKKAMDMLTQFASEYISYIRGVNPFTFATRLSPSVHGVDLIQDDWTSPIKDGLVPTKIGTFQQDAISTLTKSDAIRHQGNNVCFPSATKDKFSVGKKGFDTVFGRNKDDEPYKYKTGMPHMLMPTSDMLGKYGAKLKNIADCIRQANGIVVVYSQFVWGGIVPLAIALEHMGFMRYGAKSMLTNPEIVAPRASYPGIPFPTYCVFSGDAQVMGTTSIEELVRTVNHPSNVRGERIKVVLMSPIAGEGLSLKNVREIHVMDPWYHMNRIHQVVGRAIRTCSHTALPVQERNVVVYLHAAIGKGVETMDEHTYKIAARKSAQTHLAETVIRENALDCALVKNVHYYPKELFSFDIFYHTSRGKQVPYHFGDDLSEEPKCELPPVKNNITLRTETVAELVPTGLQRLRQYLKAEKDTRIRYTDKELIQALRYPSAIAKTVLKRACVEDALFRGYTLQRHRDGYVMRKPDVLAKPVKLRVSTERTPSASASVAQSDYEKVLSSISTTNPLQAAIRIYLSLDSDTWATFAKRVIEYAGNIPLNIRRHIDILANEGAFVMASEMPTHKKLGRSDIIGFFDLYDTKVPHIILWDEERKMYRDATQSEASSILEKRKLVEKPAQTSTLFGSLEPHKHKAQTVARFEFKLYVPGPSVGTRTGIVCINTKKPSIVESLQSVGKELTEAEVKKETKDTLCTLLSYTLKEKKQLYMPPYYKPKSASA